ncbi:MAG: 3'(2'),5'-bisphosphate nucleotidase CysQ [Rhizobiales bacterium]|nr:3'(2'),5'-bisphosphate nucleotidase CysQ [Hyphomicrobiales bacterium]
MAHRFNDSALIDRLGTLAVAAGHRVMAHYGCASTTKADGSPVTAADQEAEEIILEGLAALLPGVPVLAEESAAAGKRPATTDLFVAVDPLDGTREFIARNGEFTVNIGLVSAGNPVAGIVYAPARHRLWIGAGSKAEAMTLAPGQAITAAADRSPIHTRPVPAEGPVALVSRSHPEPTSEAFLARHGVTRRMTLGSSLKYAVIAEGGADLTVRFGPIAEWDIAAGHAVLVAAGGRMTIPDGTPIVYGRAEADFRTTSFLASSGAFRLAG